MAKLPLSQTVDASRSKRTWRSSVLALLTSSVVQGLAIFTLVVTPLLVGQAMPEPVDQLTLPRFVPARVEPPVQGAPTARAERPGTATRPPRLDVEVIAPPIEIPDGIPENDEYFADGDPAGVPGGVPASFITGHPSPPEPVPAADANPEPVLIDGNLRPPRKLVHVDPIYPRIAIEAQVEGTVELRAVIDIEGRVSDVIVVVSRPLLDRAAIEAVRQWRYEPMLQNGRAVPVIMTVAVEFVLRR